MKKPLLKRSWWLLMALFAAVLIALFTGVFSQQYSGTYDIEIPVEEVHTLRISSAEVEIELQRRDAAWMMTKPMEAPVPTISVTNTLKRIAELEVDQVVSERKADYEFHGVDQVNGRQIEVLWDGGRFSFVGAGQTETAQGDYIRIGKDPRVFSLKRRFFVNADVDSWRDKLIGSWASDEVTRVHVQRPDESYRLSRSEEEWTFGDGSLPDSAAVARFMLRYGRLLSDGFFDDMTTESVRERADHIVTVEAEQPTKLYFVAVDQNFAVAADGIDTVFKISGNRIYDLAPAKESLVRR